MPESGQQTVRGSMAGDQASPHEDGVVHEQSGMLEASFCAGAARHGNDQDEFPNGGSMSQAKIEKLQGLIADTKRLITGNPKLADEIIEALEAEMDRLKANAQRAKARQRR